MSHPGAPTEVMLLSDCVAGARRRGTLAAVDRLHRCIRVVGVSLCGGLFVLCRSVGVLCETRRPLVDR